MINVVNQWNQSKFYKVPSVKGRTMGVDEKWEDLETEE